MTIQNLRSEAREKRHLERARKARKWARVTMLALALTTTAALWQDKTFGPQMQRQAHAALGKVKSMLGKEASSVGLVDLAMNKLTAN